MINLLLSYVFFSLASVMSQELTVLLPLYYAVTLQQLLFCGYFMMSIFKDEF